MGSIGPWQIVLISLVVLAIGLIPQIFYLLTLQRVLQKVSPHNRRMPPGQVWLQLIPLFNLVWRFIMVNNIAESLKAEFQERGISSREEKPGYTIGMVYCGLLTGSVIPIPVLNVLAALGGLVCWIIYWVRINDFGNQLSGVGYSESRPLDDTRYTSQT